MTQFLYSYRGMFSLSLFCGISLCSAMDQQRPLLRMGLVIFDTEKEKKLNTHDMLKSILQIPPLDGIENKFNGLKIRGSNVDCQFQKAWYDKRHAALAAHLIIKGVSLKNNKGENLADCAAQLKANQFNKMSAVIDYGYLWHHLKPMVTAFEKGELSEAEKQKNAFKIVLGVAAFEALKLAYDEGKNLIGVMEYQSAIGADCMYVFNSDQTLTIKNFIGGDYVLNPSVKK